MAKDPAVLFYTSDFLSGTFTMTDDQVGKYMRLLCIQHQKGELSEKDMQSVCKAYDEQVYDKFEKVGGIFFNKRMKEEADKRKKFCESRRKSAQSTNNQPKNKKAYAKRMENENENINEDVIRDAVENFGRSENLFNWDSEKLNFFNDWKWKEKFCRDKNLEIIPLEKKMEEFINDIELREEYKPLKELKSHFTNLFNKQKNGHSIASKQLGTSGERNEAARNW